MKRLVWFTAVCFCAALLLAEAAQARPGGGPGPGARRGGPGTGGGGPSGGGGPGLQGNLGGGPASGFQGQLGGSGLPGRPGQQNALQGKLGGGNFSGQNLQQHLGLDGKAQQRLTGLKAQFSPENQPFTPAWYAEHPNAWQYTHPHADAWAAATFASAATWLGWAATQPATAYGSTYVVAEDGTVPDETAPTQQAAELAQQGSVATGDGGEWFSLGVYALAPPGQGDATAMFQLAVNRQGVVRGNYFDVLSNQGQAVQGRVEKSSQRVAWTAGQGSKVFFQTGLNELTQGSTPVTVHFPSGQTKLWTLVRQQGSVTTSTK